MRVAEQYYTPAEVGAKVRLHIKTVLEHLHAGAFGNGVANVGTELRPAYRIPASGLNAWLADRRVFVEGAIEVGETVPDLGVTACSRHELARKAGGR